MRRTLPCLLGVVAIAVLAGCSSEPRTLGAIPASPDAPTASASPTTSPPTPTPTPTPGEATVTILPDCASLLTPDEIRSATRAQNAEYLWAEDDFDGSFLPGPVAQQAFASASAAVTCTYGIPMTDAIASVSVALISPATSENLIDALSSSARYTATTHGDIPVFSMTIEEGLGSTIAYAFDANVWAIADGTFLSEETAASLAVTAITGVVAAPQ
ncbi:hypothetical protein ACFVR6_07455 [Microbacterium sp. NPDC058021]|uniref:hypothetical protein n=1 Tax=Microbacterium sp. NPDC058021 TaxID=3346306 RepID=UPI0036D911B9